MASGKLSPLRDRSNTHNKRQQRFVRRIKGKEATVETPLKLSGTINLRGIVPARSTMGFIDADALVEIEGMEGFELLVKRRARSFGTTIHCEIKPFGT